MTEATGIERSQKAAAPATAPLLSVRNIEVVYDKVILVLRGLSLEVPKGAIVALLGANGAGKSTTLKAISNLLLAERGKVTKGSVEFVGQRVDGLSPSELVRRGCIQVMEGRHCFGHLTVEENLLTGAYTRSGAETLALPTLSRPRTVVPSTVVEPLSIGKMPDWILNKARDADTESQRERQGLQDGS
jgi:ABC-type branched-subunit amino acid transport system ATPase component